MFSAWKAEKAKAALVDEAQALADRLETAKPHILDGYAAAAWFWDVAYLAKGTDLHSLDTWQSPAVDRFISAAQTRITSLRKTRDYDSSDGLSIWLHTARAVAEPRIAPAVRAIWQSLAAAGPNAAPLAADLIAQAGLTGAPRLSTPAGFNPLQGED